MDAIVLVAHMGIENENDIVDTGVTDIVMQTQSLMPSSFVHAPRIDKAIVNGVIITEPDKYGRAPISYRSSIWRARWHIHSR